MGLGITRRSEPFAKAILNLAFKAQGRDVEQRNADGRCGKRSREPDNQTMRDFIAIYGIPAQGWLPKFWNGYSSFFSRRRLPAMARALV
jgi:hypothetical protein